MREEAAVRASSSPATAATQARTQQRTRTDDIDDAVGSQRKQERPMPGHPGGREDPEVHTIDEPDERTGER